MGDLGLVLSGGGGRGAYQIGVWKTLRRLGIARHICAVSGTSVGALNAALFAALDVDTAEQIWLSISQDIIADPADAIGKVLSNLVKFARSEDKKITKKRVSKAISKGLNSGIFSREGLVQLIEKHGIGKTLHSSAIPCFACCCSTEDLSAQYFDLRAYSPEMVTRLLIASSAIPAAFPPEYIEKERFIDGGIADNTPVKPLYDIGIRRFIVSYLSDDVIDKSDFPDAEFIELVPTDEIYLGEKKRPILNSGTMDFNAENAARRIALGEKESALVLSSLPLSRLLC